MARWLIRFYGSSVCRINLHWRCAPTSHAGSPSCSIPGQKFKIPLIFEIAQRVRLRSLQSLVAISVETRDVRVGTVPFIGNSFPISFGRLTRPRGILEALATSVREVNLSSSCSPHWYLIPRRGARAQPRVLLISIS